MKIDSLLNEKKFIPSSKFQEKLKNLWLMDFFRYIVKNIVA
jgi:hypothetical protein